MNCYYVDKTAHVRRLVEGGKYYFLSRPRRFGKSLFLDTLQELFEGNEELFRGLAVHGEWDWSARHPVVRISFGSGEFGDPDGVREDVEDQLASMESRAGLELGPVRASIRFRRLIRTLHERTGRQVVVLVDEYDKPILDALSKPDVARANRDFLRSLYGIVKDCDRHLRFVFLTGVSKFSKAGLFSGLNNLSDITLDERYGAICGYTDNDLDTVFAPELEGLDRDEIRRWYSGYSWRGPDRVPFDILLLFDKREFSPYWFGTGTPIFLVDFLSRRQFATPTLEGMVADDALLSAFEVDEISIEALLFQTGYLTIVGEEVADGGILYRLDYPNHEVRFSLNRRLLRVMAPGTGRETARQASLGRLTAEDDLEGVRALFEAFFASIPYDWYRRNDIAHYEGYWASLVYSHFAAAGLDVRVEEMTARGRLDMAVLCPGHVHLYEFKMVDREPAGQALAQMRKCGYADKYRRPDVPVRLIGVEFDREERNIVGFTVETA